MAGIDHRRFGKRKQLRANSLEQLLHVAPQVGPTDRTGEQDIAPKHKGRIEVVANEDDRARAMTGNLANLELQPGDLDPFAVGHQAVGCGTVKRNSERGAQVSLGVAQTRTLRCRRSRVARLDMPLSWPDCPRYGQHGREY